MYLGSFARFSGPWGLSTSGIGGTPPKRGFACCVSVSMYCFGSAHKHSIWHFSPHSASHRLGKAVGIDETPIVNHQASAQTNILGSTVSDQPAVITLGLGMDGASTDPTAALTMTNTFVSKQTRAPFESRRHPGDVQFTVADMQALRMQGRLLNVGMGSPHFLNDDGCCRGAAS